MPLKDSDPVDLQPMPTGIPSDTRIFFGDGKTRKVSTPTGEVEVAGYKTAREGLVRYYREISELQ